jgi:hypothetical protein
VKGTTALDLAEELIVLRDLAWGLPTMASPKYKAMTPDQIRARQEEIELLLKEIKISKEPPPKARVTARDFLPGKEGA